MKRTSYPLLGMLLILNFSFSQESILKIKGIDLMIKKPNFEKIVSSDFHENNIFWLGEAHGTKSNYEVTFKYFKYLVENVGVDYFILEKSRLTEIHLNKYLKTGDENILKEAIENYKNTFAFSKENFIFFQNLYKLYTSIPNNKKFRFVSIDLEQTFNGSHKYITNKIKHTYEGDALLKELKTNLSSPETKKGSFKTFYTKLKNYLNQDKISIKKTFEDVEELEYLVDNFLYNLKSFSVQEKGFNIIRDSLMYENFKKRDKELDFASNKSFAFFGTDHCYKKENKKNEKWIASLISTYRPDLKQNSTVILYSKSKFMLPKGYIPKIVRPFFKKVNDKFYIEKFRNNDNMFVKHKVIRHLKRNKSSNQTMWKVKVLNSKWNFINNKKKNLLTSDYIDNIILITNSKFCTPFN